MIIKGNGFKYFFNNEEKTKEEIKELSKYATNITVGNGSVHYFSPKKKINKSSDLAGAYDFKLPDTGTIYDIASKRDLKILEFLGFSAQKKTKTENLLEEVNKHQEQNGGRVVGVEFPFDAVLTPIIESYSENGDKSYFDRGGYLIGEDRTLIEKKIIKDWNSIDIPKFKKFELDEDYWRKYSDIICGSGKRIGNLTISRTKENKTEGIKETEGKLHYEISWEFIEEMAKRMANNKSDKYPLYNWKKSINVQDLKDAINRHHIEVMKGNYSDGEEILGHIVSYACNSMMLWEQLKEK